MSIDRNEVNCSIKELSGFEMDAVAGAHDAHDYYYAIGGTLLSVGTGAALATVAVPAAPVLIIGGLAVIAGGAVAQALGE